MNIRNPFRRKPTPPQPTLNLGGPEGWFQVVTLAQNTARQGMRFWSIVSMTVTFLWVLAAALAVYLIVSWLAAPHDDMVRMHCSQAYDPDACMRLLTEPAKAP